MTGRILIADTVAAERIVLKARLASHAYDIVQAATAQEVIEIARSERPDIVILPLQLGATDGIGLYQSLQLIAETRRIPVILRLDRADCRSRLRALEAGIDAVIDMSAEPALLSARIRNLLRRHASEAELQKLAPANSPGFGEPCTKFKRTSQIVLVAPRLCDGQAWSKALAGRIRERIHILPETTALTAIIREASPDVIIVMENPEFPDRALHLISEFRSSKQTMQAALLLVQDSPGPHRAAAAMDIGVNDLTDTGFNAEELALRIRRELAHKARADRYRAALKDGLRQAITDPLTGLFNRRYAMARLETFGAEAERDETQYAVMLLDLDRFKSINDRYGHAAGDAVLVEVAGRMRQCLRQDDLLARIGGEEFLAVIRGTSLVSARNTADRIRSKIGAAPIRLPVGKESVTVTASIGLMMSDRARPQNCEQLLGHADRALYGAKADGRNQVTVCHDAA